MQSSETRHRLGVALALLVGLGRSPAASAQQAARGFALERLAPAAPGSGWFIMDSLAMSGGLGGAMGLTMGYARNPLRLSDGDSRLAVVSDQAFADFGFAATYDRLRLSLHFAMPLVTRGNSGRLGGFTFTAPALDAPTNPDTLTDARLGLEARFFGAADGAFRLGGGAQLFVPNGLRADYDTDNTYRATARVLFAGDVATFTYAGHLGVHLRKVDDGPTPGSPRGSELLFGVAAGYRVPLGSRAAPALVVGPELFGESAARSLLRASATGIEGLLTARVEQIANDAPRLRFKLGGGGGIHAQFGAPEWRALVALEVSDAYR